MNFCSEPERNRNVDEILAIVNDEAPNLLNGLALSNTRNIARTIEVKIYKNNDVLFEQNDPPDAYYTVLRGAVSIYSISSVATISEEEKLTPHRLKFGKFLVQLSAGAGFGELSFSGDGNHTNRNAGIVADGFLSHQMDHHDQENSPKALAKKLESDGKVDDDNDNDNDNDATRTKTRTRSTSGSYEMKKKEVSE